MGIEIMTVSRQCEGGCPSERGRLTDHAGLCQWYAIHAKPHQEYAVERALERVGVETFCPRLRRRKAIRRKWREVIVPLFPGYLFGRFSLRDHHRHVMYARGVRRLVSFGQAPVVVDESLIDAIRSQHDGGYVVVRSTPYAPGQIVRIRSGSLCGLEAVFEREMGDHDRAVLLLRALSYQARVVVPLDHLAMA
jgi:transcriptional antiterminator RfaH